ncbi:Sulfite reductase [ferredoxin] [Polaromonas vacuolata]|uniref:Sulfite reductase [ferredoxin] n=1 Tax=Polaromonas vacuolata TaxID=37448 RepID=A0A6H2HBI8_9BURK|nr:precorrin-3B synthase [Polaromonas vacuolata]QJC57235.1 Sulfite reductase [ferredoxin] [Polaromonas vacuolata]
MQIDASDLIVKSIEKLIPLAKPLVKGWCPGALRPMLSGDGLVVRIRPPAGRLSHEQAAGIAELAQRFGNGLIDLTNRANLQLRGVMPAALTELTDGLRGLELIDASPEIEARRNIVVTPFWTTGDGTLHIAEALANALSQLGAPALPSKFGFAVDTASQLVLQTTPADIRIERRAGSLFVYADGFSCGAQVILEQAVPVAIALAHWCVSNMAAQLANPRQSLRLAKALLPAMFQVPLPVSLPELLPELSPAPSLAQEANLSAQIGVNPHGYLVGIVLGQMSAQLLMQLAATAARFGSGSLRMTPWRMLLIEQLFDAHDLPQSTGLITRADDPLLRVVACSGAPACLQANLDTRALARVLAPHVPVDALLHISGCSKGCAHQKATMTLVGTTAGIDMIRCGNAAATPDVFAVPTDTVLQELKRLLHATPI